MMQVTFCGDVIAPPQRFMMTAMVMMIMMSNDVSMMMLKLKSFPRQVAHNGAYLRFDNP